jgi:plastocyanin
MRNIGAICAAAAASAVLLAGCGGGGDNAATETSHAAATGAGPAAQGSGTRLTGTVGPGYTITLEQGGKNVTSLPAGQYTFVVTDQSSIHGFTLEQEEGGDFEQDLTAVPSQGTQTVTVKLTPGEWKFYCPPHESQMNGTFTVT